MKVSSGDTHRKSPMDHTSRLKKNEDFRKVYSLGASVANRLLVLYFLENGLTESRLGISVSKKVGNSVVRHHTKRRIREAYRLGEEGFPAGLDFVVIARPAAAGKSFFEIREALGHLLKKSKISFPDGR